MDKSIQIDTFSRFTQVSRETIISLNKYEDLLIKANENLRLGFWSWFSRLGHIYSYERQKSAFKSKAY